MNNSIQFLKLMRRGYNPQELFEQAYSEQEKKIYESFHKAILSMISKQQEMQKDVSDVVDFIGSVEVLKPAKKILKALKIRHQQLSDLIERTTNAIAQIILEVGDRRQNIATLEQELENLRENYIKLKKSDQDPNLLNFFEILCKNTSLTTQSMSDNGQEINIPPLPNTDTSSIPPLPNTDTSIPLFKGSQVTYKIASRTI